MKSFEPIRPEFQQQALDLVREAAKARGLWDTLSDAAFQGIIMAVAMDLQRQADDPVDWKAPHPDVK